MDAWRARLEERDAVAAWDLFLERYRKLIFATIKRLTPDSDDVMDVFVLVCEALRADDLARLRRFSDTGELRASFSTWLVTVVRNLTIDWLRHRDGRARVSGSALLPPIQARIRELLANGCSHVEAFETIRSRHVPPLSFAAFLKDLNEVYRAAGRTPFAVARHEIPTGAPMDLSTGTDEPLATIDAADRIAAALATLSAADRLAVQLFVVDGLGAAEVARTVGWANSKTVYNRVYRALRMVRTHFERQGIGRDDL